MNRLRVLVLIVLVAVLVALAFRARLSSDFWPLDSSRVGPNLLASVVQWVIVLVVMSFLYPPLRDWIKSEFGRVHDKLDGHHKDMMDQAERHHQEHMEKLDDLKESK